jgi:branched-chain amino acid aminotransferase
VIVMIAEGRLNPLDPMAGHKTLNYWPRIASLQVAAGRGAGEALWFSVSNHLCCGSVSNVFLVKDEVLHTPIARDEEEPGALRSPVLPGITRQCIIDLAQTMRFGVTTHMLDINDVLEADEMFLTNASWGVLPVVGVEKEAIGDGNVGRITQRLRDAWLDEVQRDTTQIVDEDVQGTPEG